MIFLFSWLNIQRSKTADVAIGEKRISNKNHLNMLPKQASLDWFCSKLTHADTLSANLHVAEWHSRQSGTRQSGTVDKVAHGKVARVRLVCRKMGVGKVGVGKVAWNCYLLSACCLTSCRVVQQMSSDRMLVLISCLILISKSASCSTFSFTRQESDRSDTFSFREWPTANTVNAVPSC